MRSDNRAEHSRGASTKGPSFRTRSRKVSQPGYFASASRILTTNYLGFQVERKSSIFNETNERNGDGYEKIHE